MQCFACWSLILSIGMEKSINVPYFWAPIVSISTKILWFTRRRWNDHASAQESHHCPMCTVPYIFICNCTLNSETYQSQWITIVNTSLIIPNNSIVTLFSLFFADKLQFPRNWEQARLLPPPGISLTSLMNSPKKTVKTIFHGNQLKAVNQESWVHLFQNKVIHFQR